MCNAVNIEANIEDDSAQLRPEEKGDPSIPLLEMVVNPFEGINIREKCRMRNGGMECVK